MTHPIINRLENFYSLTQRQFGVFCYRLPYLERPVLNQDVSRIVSDSLTNALLVDFPVSLALKLGTTLLFTGTLPGIAVLGTAAAYSVAGGFCSYTIRHMFRENGEPTLAGGAIGGTLKYLIKGNNPVVGLSNNGVYEYIRPTIGSNLKNLKVLAPIIMAIEGFDEFCSSILSSKSWGETMCNTAVGMVAGALIAVCVNKILVPYTEMVEKQKHAELLQREAAAHKSR